MPTFQVELNGHKFTFRTAKRSELIELRCSASAYRDKRYGVIVRNPLNGQGERVVGSPTEIEEASQNMLKLHDRVMRDAVVSVDGCEPKDARVAFVALIDDWSAGIDADELWTLYDAKGTPGEETSDPKGESKQDSETSPTDSASPAAPAIPAKRTATL